MSSEQHPYAKERRRLRHRCQSNSRLEITCPGCGENKEIPTSKIMRRMTKDTILAFQCHTCYSTAELSHVDPTPISN